MKYVLVLSTMFAASAFAQGVIPSVDYQQCQRAIGFMGPQLNSHGEFDKEASGMLPAPDIDTKKLEDGGSRITYTYKAEGGPWSKGKPVVSTYVIEKDKDGNLKKIITGGDKVDNHQIKMHKAMMLEGAVYTGVPMGGLTNDPIMTISMNNQGFYQTPLSKMDSSEAKKFGVDMDELRKLRSEKRKDGRVLKKLRDGYTKLFDKAPMMIPNGSEAEVEIKDGSCALQKVSHRVYDPKKKENHVMGAITRERCDAINKISKKYEKEMQACATASNKMSQEFFALNNNSGGYIGGTVGGATGGATGGSVGGIQGGYVGGGQGGSVGGIAGGYGQGMGMNMGIGMGMNDTWQCQSYFADFNQQQYGHVGGQNGGVSAGKVVNKKAKAVAQ
jgi:hypothetical protein